MLLTYLHASQIPKTVFQGFVEYDQDAEDNFGQTGSVIRKKRVSKEKQHKHLSGNAGRELYLECLQLILRKQIAWLIREWNLPVELEIIARDFWDLRVRGFGGLRLAKEKSKRAKTRSASGKSDEGVTSSDGEAMMLFSSQGGSGAESDATTATSDTGRSRGSRRIKTWAVSEGQRWAMPTLLDTLALSYVACLVMRRPVRVVDLMRAARTGKLTFIRAVSWPYAWFAGTRR